MHDVRPALIQALLAPGLYPGKVHEVTLIETHISWVLLAGEYAYKIKKPVKLPFLDFSTLALRQQFCETELQLNRRFAPELYLDVEAITGKPEHPVWGGEGAPIEYAVKMRRFDEAGRLDHLCAQGALTPDHVSALAQRIVHFHDQAAIAPESSRFATPDEILAPVMDNFDGLQRLLHGTLAQSQLARLHDWSRLEFDRLGALLVARKVAGRVRECHGDLHLGNIALIDGIPTLFDCIEFSESLRWIDTASEIAFVYIDLLDHRQPGLASWFLNEWLQASGDHEAVPLLRFYAVYRAMVRAKVAAIRREQTGEDDGLCSAYLALAGRLISPSKPRLVITHGLSGCGKTVASSQLLQHDASGMTLRLRSDVERKRLFGLAPQEKSHSGVAAGIYGQQASEQTYAHLMALARRQLQAGWSTVVDAAFLQHAERDAFARLALELGVDFFILAPQASPAQLRARILARQAQGHDASEANLEVLERQMVSVQPLSDQERTRLLSMATR
ncbi:MAG: AAA family ATPase [Gammaproteobacteria bacterium]|nr:AAA family ATPase [Gammaproteobacteria bacterium]MBU0788568.1 AAA family ATPase [Gammaproteobacteria bacterium]MBU0815608.1 AAA family ATPase [Gammaproteobacteria bacterium]MBU1788184.1 AAA family ATPase [Gammaproteobacteria bacterium]